MYVYIYTIYVLPSQLENRSPGILPYSGSLMLANLLTKKQTEVIPFANGLNGLARL